MSEGGAANDTSLTKRGKKREEKRREINVIINAQGNSIQYLSRGTASKASLKGSGANYGDINCPVLEGDFDRSLANEGWSVTRGEGHSLKDVVLHGRGQDLSRDYIHHANS